MRMRLQKVMKKICVMAFVLLMLLPEPKKANPKEEDREVSLDSEISGDDLLGGFDDEFGSEFDDEFGDEMSLDNIDDYDI